MGHHRCMTTAWIDTHCHLDAPEFDADRNAVRQEATVQGVGHCVIPAVERSNWETVRLLAHQHGDSYALGIHPLYTGRADDGDVALLQEMLAQHHADPRLVAIGEIGLDYFVPGLDPTRQERFYRAQLQLARRFDLPVILHVRRSADKLLKGLTYDRALQLRRLAAELPEEALVLETDAPDIPPHWLYTPAAQRAEGLPQGRNAPAELPRIAEVLAQLRGQPLAALAQATTANACAALPRLVPLLALRGIDGEIEE